MIGGRTFTGDVAGVPKKLARMFRAPVECLDVVEFIPDLEADSTS